MNQSVQSRLAALRVLNRIIEKGQTLSTAFDCLPVYETLSHADKQFSRLLVLTALRRYGQINAVIHTLILKPLPLKRQIIRLVLVLGLVQIYYLKTPPHAAVDTCVSLVKVLKQSAFAGFVNGVLRNFVRKLPGFVEPDILLNLPSWIKKNWETVYSEAQIRLFSENFAKEPPLDIFVKSDPALWADRLNGTVLSAGSVRCACSGDITKMPGYTEGAWWVQEASAAIPVLLFPDLKGKKVADFCAAPGGKTAQLVCRGAFVDAFDISAKRIQRLRENMQRLKLEQQVHILCRDVLTLKEKEIYDAVLLDAPCSATGTLRRHPDLMFHRTQEDVIRLSETQKKLLKKAICLTKKGGYIVYSTCSLEVAENEAVVESVLAENHNVCRVPLPEKWHSFLNQSGAIQILPSQNQDGFYAVLMKKNRETPD